MKIIAVDDEKLLLDDLIPRLKKQEGVSDVFGFTSPQSALSFLQNNIINIAFLDIRMPGMSGLVLAKEIKEQLPDVKIVFLTAYSEYAVEAFKLRLSGYLLKPVTDEEIAEELRFATTSQLVVPNCRIKIQTFGNFEIFVEGMPVRFARSKSKEVLAYLVDRHGASATKKEIASIIWEDGLYSRSRQVQLETIIGDLINSLKNVNAENILLRSRGILSVDPSAFECDYYKFCKWEITAINSYRGEYMRQYSWAEFTNAFLESEKMFK